MTLGAPALPTAVPATRPAGRKTLGMLAALGVGATIAVQSRVNGELGQRLHDGVFAAVISFGGGLLLLLVAVPLLPSGRRGVRRIVSALRDGTLKPWQCLGGVCGALFVVSQGFTVASLGVAVFTVAVVAGQAGSSLLVDRAGIGPAGAQPLTGTRIAGAVLAVVAVLIAVSEKLGTPAAIGLAVFPALTGVGMAWQQAVNGRVRAAADAAVPAALVNFLTGTAALLLFAVIDVAVRGWPGPLPAEPVLYFGGLVGVVFIAAAAALVRITGVLLLGLGSVAGQLLGALAMDLVAPTPGQPVSTLTLVGTGLTLVAVVIAGLPGRKAGTGPRTGGPSHVK